MKFKMVGDFETTTKEKDCRVWASCLYDIDNDRVLHLSNNIKETFEFLKVNSKKHTLEVYYHNIKFDGEFLLSFMFENGFKYDDTLSNKNTFKTLITDTGIWYGMELKFYKSKNAKKVVFRDSLKIIPLPVEAMAKSFGLDTLKGEINYKKRRPVGHQLTKKEIDYIVSDCKIVSQSLKAMFDLGLTKMTIASNAMNHYKELMGGNRIFRMNYPILNFTHLDGAGEVKTVDEFFRKSYKGGYTYCQPKHQGKEIKQSGCTYDVNGLYSGVMMNDILPYGMPVYFKGEYVKNELYPLSITHIKCKFKLKKGYVPTIQLKNNSRFLGRETEYLSDSGTERVDLYLTNVDLERVKEHYILTRIEYIGGYMFKGKRGLFDDYINYWSNLKIKADIEGNMGLRQICKLMLNSLYGKFACNTVNDLKIPVSIDEVTSLKSKIDIKEQKPCGYWQDIELKDDRARELCYTAMASFITSGARRITISAIQENYDNFCYADTDSIHLIGTKAVNITIHPTELGSWKHESNWCYAKFIRAKTYMEEIEMKEIIKDGEKVLKECLDGNYTHTKLDVKCAGMPKNCKKAITKENFKIGFTTKGMASSYQKLVPKRVKGGVILVETDFTIK